MKRKLIKTINIDKANFEHIAKIGNINGTLLIEIERIMDEYAKQESSELLEALNTVFDLIDRGVLVRDVSKDHDFGYFTKQGIEISNAMILVNEAIKKATK